MAVIIGLFVIAGFVVRLVIAVMPQSDVVPVVEDTDFIGARVQKIMVRADEHLNRYVPFYVALSSEGKKRFRQRLRHVLATKSFFAPRGEKLTIEKFVVTAAGLVQMTFGMENWSMPYIRRFVIYDDLVSERYFKHDYKGLTTGSGVVRLSWKYIKDGFMNPTDGVNLALHELAHGIEVSIKKEQHIDEYIARAFDDFHEHFLHVSSDVLAQKLGLFSERDLRVSSEFFASCVELFFERPADLRSQHLELYDLMRYCFKLDPMRHDDDFQVEAMVAGKLEHQFGERLRSKQYFSPDQSSLMTYIIEFFILAGMVIGIPIGVYKIVQLIDPYSNLMVTGMILLVVGLILFKKRLLDSGFTSGFSFGIFLVFGWLPISLSLALVLNDIFIIDQRSEAYSIAGARYVSSEYGVVVVLDGVSQTKYSVSQRSIPSEYIPLYKTGEKKDFQFVVHSARGIFMMDIYEGASLIKKRT